MPIKSFLNQKLILKIRPEQAEININRNFFKKDKPVLNKRNISKSKIIFHQFFAMSSLPPTHIILVLGFLHI